MSKKTDKVNLDLLKKLVSELEKSLEVASLIEPSESSAMEYITEMARASGLAGVVMQEANLLVKDIYTLVRLASTPSPVAEADVMSEIDKILGSPGTKRNTN